MRRRQFITLLGGTAAAWPLAARAQQPAMPVVGFIHSASATYLGSMTAAFSEGLRETGFVEGQNVAIEYRWAEGHYDRLPALAAELVARRPAVIFAGGSTEPARAVKAATATIPIVFVSAADPVQMGLVASLNRPGGNVTGASLLGSALEAKRLELLHQLMPKTPVVAVLLNPKYPAFKTQVQEVQEAAAQLGVKLIMLNASTVADIEASFPSIARQDAGALLVTQDPLFGAQREQIVALAAKHSLPAIYWQREFIAVGGLISYGPNFPEAYHQAGLYVGKILKGEKPAELPIVQPTKFDLVLNLKTAKTLNIDVPPNLLALADEVIE
jgi:putative ABC transport system substrate-binding protein